MAFRNLQFYSFRNLTDRSIDTSAREIILVGENGQGKTNFLEAIHLLCYGSSFRTSRDTELITFGEESCRVSGTVSREPLDRRVSVSLGPALQGKNIEVDGTKLKDRRELLSVQPCIVFCHDDIRFVSGTPELQRLFLDQTAVLHDTAFVDARRRYARILRQRNDALKQGKEGLLDAFDHQLAETGGALMIGRQEAVDAFNDVLKELYGPVSEDTKTIVLRYQPSWQAATEAEKVLFDHRNGDLNLGTTTSGPHRDRLLFSSAGRDFVATASTGQQRLLSLLLRLGQVHSYHRVHDRLPILLLDDVLLELDRTRRERFLSHLPPVDQAFYTFLPQEQLPEDTAVDRLVYSVQNGVIAEHG